MLKLKLKSRGNMKTIIKLILICLLPTLSFAYGLDPLDQEEDHPFDKVSEWYLGAKSTTVEKSLGVYKGKCFDFRNRLIKKDRYLTVMAEEYYGPGFPMVGKVVQTIMHYKVSDDEAKANSIEYTLRNWDKYKSLRLSSPLKWTNPIGSNLGGEVKEYSTFLVTLEKFTEDVPVGDQDTLKQHPNYKNGVVPAGSAYAACYFYNKLKIIREKINSRLTCNG